MLGAAATARLAVLALVASAAAAAATTAATGPVNSTPDTRPQYDDECMMCVCRANGKNRDCVTDEKCTHGDTYGPFCISLGYWKDAGKPVLAGDDKDLPGAFQRCVEEPFCAVQTVRGYMETGPALQDCDHDGTITCRDLMLTHVHGRYGCKDQKDGRVDLLMSCLNATISTTTTAISPTTTTNNKNLTRPTPTRPSPTRQSVGPGSSPYPGQAAPHNNYHSLADGIHFPGSHGNPDATSHQAGGFINDQGGRVGGYPNYASRFAFNSLQEGGNLHGPDNTFTSSEFTDEMKNQIRQMEIKWREHANTMREQFQRMGENVPGNLYPQPNGGNVGGYQGPDWS